MKNCSEATEALATISEAGLDAPIPLVRDARWGRLKFQRVPGVDLRDRYRGALVGGAIGGAMGRPNEGTPTDVARGRRQRAYEPWRGWAAGPVGTVTDDTQMTLWPAESILATADRGPRRAPPGCETA